MCAMLYIPVIPVSQQMVALYKDPKGEHVFDAIKASQEEWHRRHQLNTADIDKTDDTVNMA